MLKIPFSFVEVPRLVPFTMIEAFGIASEVFVSEILPDIVFWATADIPGRRKHSSRKNRIFLMIKFLVLDFDLKINGS
jgi:hypothetical protein